MFFLLSFLESGNGLPDCCIFCCYIFALNILFFYFISHKFAFVVFCVYITLSTSLFYLAMSPSSMVCRSAITLNREKIAIKFSSIVCKESYLVRVGTLSRYTNTFPSFLPNIVNVYMKNHSKKITLFKHFLALYR